MSSMEATEAVNSGVKMAQFVASRVATCIGADYSNFAVLDRSDQRTIRLFHSDFLDTALAHRYAEFDIDSAFPIAVTVRTGRVVALSGAADYAARFPEMWADTVAAGITATVSLPLIRGDGSPIGALGFAWTVTPKFDASLDTALQALAELCIEIVERAEIYEVEHELLGELHHRLLSPVPPLSGLESAARYLPADASAWVGGDWYEGLVLDGGARLAVVVGDVVGHGLSAAADMALVRGLITALLLEGVAVADVFERVMKVLGRRGETIMASAAVVVINTASSTLSYATAGHPPPLLIGAGGEVTLLDSANGTWLGAGPTRQLQATEPFPVGSTLVMYTDGLVERRDRPLDAGISEMSAYLSSTARLDSAENLIDSTIETLMGDRGHDDDIAVVIIKHVGTRTGPDS
jgi:serine phosphatase RsbU (regulator of sigma subunit)